MAAALLLLMTVAVTGTGCGDKVERTSMVLATTTSAEDSGILVKFVKEFEKRYPYEVKSVAVGSGAALFMGRCGNADVLLTHEPVAEAEFVEGGYSVFQDKVMHNDFIVVGPEDDPAGIEGTTDAEIAFQRIYDTNSDFVSRADASGTNAMELTVWGRLGINPADDGPYREHYVESGSSMGETVRVADQLKAYTLVDRATFIVMEKALKSSIMCQGDPRLVNQYTVSVVNPEMFSSINHAGACAFREYLLDKDTKRMINDFGWKKYGQRLFYSD